MRNTAGSDAVVSRRASSAASAASSGVRSGPPSCDRSMPSAMTFVEHAEALVEPGGHAVVVGATTRKHEHDTRRLLDGRCQPSTVAVVGAQQPDRRRRVGCRHDTASRHLAATTSSVWATSARLGVRFVFEERSQALGAGCDGLLVQA